MLKAWLKKTPYEIRLHFVFAGLALSVLTLYRFAFFLVYSYRLDSATPASKVLLAFLVGVRFDLSVIYLLLGPFLLLSLLRWPNRWAAFRWIWVYGPILAIVWLAVISVVDIMYFENANKHIGYEAFAYLNLELFTMIGAALQRTPVRVVAALTGMVAVFFGASRVMRRFPYHPPQYGYLGSLLLLVGAVVLGGLFVRGGPQNNPLRTGDAIISKNDFVNNLGISGAFTAITDLKVTNIKKVHRLPFDASVKVVRDSIAYPGAEFISDRYPLLRKVSGRKSGRSPNIAIIVLEGWTGRYIKPITDGLVDGKEVTPYMNRLIPKGLFFPRFMASGGRTTNGLMALVGGMPDRPGLTAVRTRQILNRFSGLGNIFKQQLGYQTLFVAGNDLSFNNKRTIMRHWGFENQIGKKELADTKRFKLGAWGYNDEDILTVYHENLQRLHKQGNFVALVHTITTHYPYRTPHKRFDIFGERTRDRDYLNVYHYADWSVHQFLEKAKRSAYFNDTIFVFVSDHSHHRFLNYYEDRNVPLLLYAPGRIQPGQRNEIASQLDVLPTILGLTDREVYYSGMGRDLLKTKAGSAYFAYGNLFGWIDEEMFFFQRVEGGVPETYTVRAPFKDMRQCWIDKEKCARHSLRSRAFLNLSYQLLNENLIFPGPREFETIKARQSR